MAKKLEELLKEKGYSEADLTALAPLLTNERYRSDIESTLADYEYHAEIGRADSAEALRWRDQEALPKLASAQEEAVNARAEAASYKERLKALQDQGLIKIAEQQEPVKVAPSDMFDPKKYKLVTEDDQRAVVEKFADIEGDAIALVADLGGEYQELFPGKSLHTYIGRDGKSRGFTALRREAVAAKKPIGDYVADKFNFAARRAELQAADVAKREDAIRAEERGKLIAEYSNPMARAPRESAFSLLPKPANAQGKQPWEVEGNRQGERIARVAAKLAN